MRISRRQFTRTVAGAATAAASASFHVRAAAKSPAKRKRVALAQMLIRDPAILLMDEPFGPLDAQTRQIMGNLLLDLWAANRKAVMFVTHDLEEAIALSDRVVVLSAWTKGWNSRAMSDFIRVGASVATRQMQGPSSVTVG